MGRFIKSSSPIEFTKPIQTSNGTIWDRSSDLYAQLRATPAGIFEHIFTKNKDDFVNKAYASKRSITTSGTVNGSTFIDNYQRKAITTYFNGSDTKQTMAYNGSLGFKWVPYGSNDGTTGYHVMVSGWINLSSLVSGSPGGVTIVEHVKSDGTEWSSCLYVNSSGQLGFRVHDPGQTTVSQFRGKLVPASRSFKVGHWYHFVVIVDTMGSAQNYIDTINASDADKFHFYINGAKVPDSSLVEEVGSASFATVSGADQYDLVIGYGRGGYDSGATPSVGANAYFHGYLAELCFWRSTTIFTDTEADNIYRAVKDLRSGFIGNSERILLRELDKASHHPTVARSGDQRRLGNHAIKFDDSRAQTLEGSTIHYPTKMVSGDRLIDTVYAGYLNGNLTLPHVASFDSYSMHYRRDDQPAHGPFVENRIYIDSGSSFYQTGTLDSVLPGFDTPLHGKDVVQISLTSVSDLRLGLRGNTGTNGTIGSPNDYNNQDTMAYFNTSTEIFDSLGARTFPGTTGTDSDVYAVRNLTGSCIAFSHNYQTLTCSMTSALSVLTNDYVNYLDPNWADEFASNLVISKFPDQYYQASGKPISDFAFPDDSRYDASSNQTIKMSDYINEPFLVEKIRIKTPAVEATAKSNFGSGYSIDSNPMNRDHIAFDILSQPTIVGGAQDGNTWSENAPGTPQTAVGELTRGSFLLSPILMKQAPGPTAGSFTLDYFDATTGLVMPVTQSYSSGYTRELITYGHSFFYIPANHRNAGNGDCSIKTSAYYVLNLNDTRIVTLNLNLTSSVNRTGIEFARDDYDKDTVVRIMDNCFPHYDHRIPYGADIYSSGFPTGSNGLVFELLPKLISPTKCAGITPNAPYPIANAGSNEVATHVQRWIGGPKNISSMISPRSFGPALTGQKDTVDINLTTMFSDQNSSGQEALSRSFQFSASGSSETSLYLLHPEDELIFGLHKNAVLGSVNNQAQRVIIKAGQFDITLFGSYLRNSLPRKFQLNQLLNNDIVHESIGSESIHDQFDIEPRGAYTGSYADESMAGSTTNAPLYYGDTANGLFSTTDYLSRRIGGRLSAGTMGLTGSLRRTISLASDSTTEYDSVLWDLRSVFKRDERSSPMPNGFGGKGSSYWDDFIYEGSPLDALWLGDDPSMREGDSRDLLGNIGAKPNINLMTSFLFDRYSGTTRARLFRAAGNAGSLERFLIIATGSLTPEYAGFVEASYPGTQRTYPLNTKSRYVIPRSLFSDAGATPTGGIISMADMAKVLFTRGDGISGAHRIDPVYTSASGLDSLFLLLAPYRGFRYGLSGISDKKPRAIFRRNRYGQLRDMLEQAPNTAYIDDITNTISYPVEAKFFAYDGSVQAASNTACSNLSTYCTSSAPFFDRDADSDTSDLVVRNRNPLNNQVIDITIEI